MSTFSTHVLDAVLGHPAAASTSSSTLADGSTTALRTDDDGPRRVDADLPAGEHTVRFATGPWFAARRRDTFFPSSPSPSRCPTASTPTWPCCSARSPTPPTGGLRWAARTCWAPTSTARPSAGWSASTAARRATCSRPDRQHPAARRLRGRPHRRRQRRTCCHRHAEEHRLRAGQASTASARRGLPARAGRHLSAQSAGDRHPDDRRAVRRGSASGAGRARPLLRRGPAARRAPPSSRPTGTTPVVGGLTGLVVLKSTGSEFNGFPRDRFTTLPETDDRILATSVTAWWRYDDDRRWTGTPPTPRSGPRWSTPSPAPTAWRCSRRSTPWAPPRWTRCPRSPRSGSAAEQAPLRGRPRPRSA